MNSFPLRWPVRALVACAATVLCIAQSEKLPREVIIVFKTHFDIGYTDMASNVVQRYRTSMIDQALKVVDQNRDLPSDQQFVWTLPGWPMSKIGENWSGQKMERQQKIQEAFQQGRFVVHALPFTTHTELLEPEDLVRGLGYSSRLARQANQPLPRDAKMTDVPCHAFILPTLLMNAQVDFLHLGCNSGSSSPQVPLLFWWQGPDGSRLLTMYSATGYGTGLIPPSSWPYQTWLALIHTGDNHGPPTPAEVTQLLKEAKEKLPGVKVRIGRLSDFADAILAEKAPIPVVRGDMPDTWIHGPMCDPAGAKLARNLRPLIGVAESLHCLLGIWGLHPSDESASFAQAYEKSLLYGEHTWGGAFSWITSYDHRLNWSYGSSWKSDYAAGRFRRLESSWAEHTAYIESVSSTILPILENDMKTLAQAVGTPGPRVVVYNPLPWTRSGEVAVPGTFDAIQALKPVEGGVEAVATVHANSLRFVATDVPPMGYRTFVPCSLSDVPPSRTADSKNGILENRWFKVIIDPKQGVIRSLWNKRAQCELVDTASPHALGQYLYERFDSNQVSSFVKAYVKIKDAWAINELGKPNLPPASQIPYQAVSPTNGFLDFKHTPSGVTALWCSAPDSQLPHGVTTRVCLYEHEPYLDLEITLHDKPADPWPEAGWICLPFKVDSPQFRLGRLGGIMDPAQDIIKGANRHLFAVHTGLALFNPQGRGVGICALDNPLVSLDEPGCWKYSLDYVPRRPSVYVNLFNNQWTTNFRFWNSGTWSARIRLWSFDHYDAESCLVTPSLEARYPLHAAFANGQPGALLPAQSGLEISKRGTWVTSLAPNQEGEGIFFRLWELAGKSGPCQIRLPAGMPIKTLQPIDLRGRPIGSALPVENGQMPHQSHAFAPATYVIAP